jgi:hypothetical protein
MSSGSPLVTSRWPVPAALAALLVALAGFGAWQYGLPPTFESSFGIDHAGLHHFREALGIPLIDADPGAYTLGFRLWLAATWVAYFATIMAAAMGAPLPRRRVLTFVVVTTVLVIAVFWPPSFSVDVYGYIAYGRLQVLHGLNPYGTRQTALVGLGDPTARFLVWGNTSPYGPIWTSVSVAVVWLLRAASLFAQVVAMKLIGAAGVVAAAWAGGRAAERLAPGRGALTFLAIGLNPLLLIEGAGNAHNDLMMMALLVTAIGAALAGHPRRAALWAGVAAGIKFLPLLIVPWLLLGEWRGRAVAWARRAGDAVVYGAAALLPAAVAFVPYWQGPRTLLGLQERWQTGQVNTGFGGVSVWGQAAALVAVYASATVWVARGGTARIPMGWIIVATALHMMAVGLWFPWYLSWIWIVALLGWDRRSATVSYLAFCFAFVLTLRYSIVFQ